MSPVETSTNPCLGCFDNMFKDEGQPDDCPGLLVNGKFVSGYDEGYFMQVCPRASRLGKTATHIEFNGNGPDVIVMHRATVPSQGEYEAVAKVHDTIF